MTVPLQSEYDKRLAAQVDDTMREIIVLLLLQGFRLQPSVIDKVREHIIVAALESARLALIQEEVRSRRNVIPGPWDDEPTNPERPSNRPKKF